MKKVLVNIDFPGMTSKKYDQVWKDLRKEGHANPKGLIHHVGVPTAKGWMVSDVWESADHFSEFGKALTPILAKNEVIPSEPVFCQYIIITMAKNRTDFRVAF
jgi:hypothetical protein